MSTIDLSEAFGEVVDDLGIRKAEPDPSAAGPKRAAARRQWQTSHRALRLIERDGVYFVDEGLPPVQGRRRRGIRDLLAGGQVVQEIELERLERNQIGAALDKLDTKLTPARGLRRLQADGKLVPYAKTPSGGVLLLVHGTFSHCDNMVAELAATEQGAAFIRWALGAYDDVLTFDHPTLSVSPIINARELALRLSGSQASFDVVCHSRGGLVTRWWMDGFDRGEAALRRAVFLGAPLAGTALAAPPNLKATLSLMTNVGKALGKVAGAGATAFPFLAAVAGIFQVVSSITSVVSKTPVIDAAIAMIPGLAAMSRIGNNAELTVLRRVPLDVKNRYFCVQSNFEPEDETWKFWRWFRKDKLADFAADAVFDGPNDLVVDTVSMTGFSSTATFEAQRQLFDFGPASKTVHHTNYLRQPQTLRFIREALG